MKKCIRWTLRLLLLAGMLCILPGVRNALAATYTPKGPLQVPRIVQAKGTQDCHLDSMASVQAYVLGSYSYGGLSRTYNGVGDYTASSDPIVKKLAEKFGNEPKYDSSYYIVPMSFQVDTNVSRLMSIAYEQLSRGMPVVVYATGKNTHASIIIGYRGNSDTLQESDFTVMEIHQDWPNSKSIFNSTASSPIGYQTTYTSCYVTLNTWLNAQGRTIRAVSWPTCYPLTISSKGGTVDGAKSGDFFKKGATVTLTATPDSDHDFSGWTCSAGTLSSASTAKATFTMPGSAATVTANFKLKFGKIGKNWACSVTPQKTSASFQADLTVETGTDDWFSFTPSVTDVYLSVSQNRSVVESPASEYINAATQLYFKQFDTPSPTVTTTSLQKDYKYSFSLSDMSQLKNGSNSALTMLPETTYYYRWTCKVNDDVYSTEVKSFTTKGTAVKWAGLTTNDQGLFNAWAYYKYSDVTLKEAGCFVGTSRVAVESAEPKNIPGGVARAMDKNITVYDSGRGGTYIYYRATSFSMTFTAGVTYYYKFYSYDSTNDLAMSSVQSYTVPGSATTWTFSVNAGTGGRITKGSGGKYASGNVLEIAAAPDTGYQFDKWTATAGTLGSAGAAVTTFTMPASNAQVTASFKKQKYTLTVQAPENGSINVSTGTLEYGEQVPLRAVPEEGYEFAGWVSTRDGVFENAANAETTFTMPAGNVTICVQFAEKPENGWTYADELPAGLDLSSVQVQYNSISQTQSETSPGTGWVRGEIVSTRYVSGSEYESDFELQTSDTRKLVRYYYYHWCKTDGSDAVNYAYNASKGYVHLDEFRKVSLSYEYSQGTDSVDSRYTYYALKWKSNDSWVACKGGETCSNSDHPYRSHLWYKRYVYQDLQAIDTYSWTYESGWTDSPDSQADTVRIRYRIIDSIAPAVDSILFNTVTDQGFTLIYGLTDNISVDEVVFRTWPENGSRDDAAVQTISMVYDSVYWAVCCSFDVPENSPRDCWYLTEATVTDKQGNTFMMPGEQCRVYIPTLPADNAESLEFPDGLTAIDDEAFAGNDSITIVSFKDGITRIGSRAFADCRNLKLVILPASATDIAYDAFADSPQAVLLITGEALISYARTHEIPFITQR